MFSKIHRILVKIDVLPGVSVLFLRFYHKFISYFLLQTKEGKECSGKRVVKFVNKKKTYVHRQCLGDNTNVVLHYTCVGFHRF